MRGGRHGKNAFPTLLRRILASNPASRVVRFSDAAGVEEVESVAGADSVIPMLWGSVRDGGFIAALRAAMEGYRVFGPGTLPAILHSHAERMVPEKPGLTPRQRIVLGELIDGYKQTEIDLRHADFSLRTVHRDVSDLKVYFGIEKERAPTLVAVAVEQGYDRTGRRRDG